MHYIKGSTNHTSLIPLYYDFNLILIEDVPSTDLTLILF